MIGAALKEVTLLKELLEIPSPTGSEDAVARRAAAQMTDLGFSAERDAVGNVIGTWGDGQEEVYLVGHIDTVPGDIPVRLHAGRLHGRGAVDAKGPFATFINAVARQRRNGPTRFVVIGAVEEEGSSRGARHLIDRRAPAALVIGEPSGWQAVVVGYKGSQRLRYRLEQPVAHTAGPLPTAAERAVAFYRELADWCAQANQGKGIFDRIDPRLRGMESRSDGLTEVVTMALGLRLPPGCDQNALAARIRTWAQPGVAELDDPEAPIRTDKNSRVARALVAAIRQRGGTPRFKVKTGTSDMNILAPAWHCPAVAYGPGDSLLDHAPNESLDVDEYLRAIDVLARALTTLQPGSR
jgi:LysW-gamma-L-lysine carboxypeptidase